MSRTRTAVLTAFLLVASLVVPAAAQEISDRPEYEIVDPAVDFEALPGATAYAGTIDVDGVESAYRIEVPDDWNGQLVLYAHGFVGPDEAELEVQNPDLRPLFIAEGFAWAASSYSRNGYVIDAAIEETDALREQFNALTSQDTPTGTIIHGVSMGGHITGAAIERRPDAYLGALPVCGVMGDAALFDYFADVNLVAGALSGVDIPFPGNPALLAGPVQEVSARLGLQSGFNTPAGVQYADIVESLSGGERPTFDESLDFWNIGAAIPVDPSGATPPVPFLQALYGQALSGGITDPVGIAETYSNVDRDYRFAELEPADATLSPTEAAINADVDRYDGTGEAPFPIIEGTPQIPVMTLHTTGDLFVPIQNQVIYANEVQSNGLGDNLVQRAIRSPVHCEFTGEELGGAFGELVNWIATDTRPAGDDLTDPAVMSDRALGCAWTSALNEDSPDGRFIMPACDDPQAIDIAGDTSTDTAIAVNARTDTASDTIIARTDVFADALAGSALAGQIGAPLLLNPMDALDPDVLAELQRTSTTDVTLLGGVNALSPAVEQGLLDAGLNVTRLAGPNRFGTAAEIAAAITAAGGPQDEVFLAFGGGFADSVAVAGLASFLGQPILLTETDRIPVETQAALDALPDTATTTVVGGTAVVSDEVAGDSERLAGSNRYGTSAAVVGRSVSVGLRTNTPWVVDGEQFADALVAGPAAAASGQVMIMVDGDDLAGSSLSTALFAGFNWVDDLVFVRSGDAISDGTVGALLGAVNGGAPVGEGAGLVTLDVDGTVPDVVDAITARIEAAPPTLVTVVDHGANAAGAGLELPATELLIFGAPPVGTPLMQDARSAAIDLPQKLLVWEDADGTHATYTHPSFLAARHGLTDVDQQLDMIEMLLPTLAGADVPPAAPPAAVAPGAGLETIQVQGSVEEWVATITDRIEASPATLIQTVDHAAAAEAAGLELEPTTLLIFGAPPVGTPLMQSSRSTGIDLPQKLLVWSDAGGTYVTYNSPAYLDARHGLSGVDQQLGMIGMLLPTLATGG